MSNKTIHPNYRVDFGVAEFDVAILTLRDRVEFTPYIQPVCLPSTQELSLLSTKTFPPKT